MSLLSPTFPEDVMAMRNVCPPTWRTQNWHMCARAIMLAGRSWGALIGDIAAGDPALLSHSVTIAGRSRRAGSADLFDCVGGRWQLGDHADWLFGAFCQCVPADPVAAWRAFRQPC